MQERVKALSKAELDRVQLELTHQEEKFLNHPFLFSRWLHGGEPGPDYVSEALDLTGKKGARVEGTFLQAMFDFQYDPPQYTETFQDTVEPRRVTALLRQMLRTGLWSEEFPAERDPQVADNLKETWQFDFESVKLEKTFYEPFPPSLEAMREVCQSLVEQLKRTGKRTVERPQSMK